MKAGFQTFSWRGEPIENIEKGAAKRWKNNKNKI
jgi:hypothetical protein